MLQLHFILMFYSCIMAVARPAAAVVLVAALFLIVNLELNA